MASHQHILLMLRHFETLQRRLPLLEGIARGENAIEEGRFVLNSRPRKYVQMAEVIWTEGAESACSTTIEIKALAALN